MLDHPRIPTTMRVTITPDMALKWLRSNAKNRVKSRSLVVDYARAMNEGRWRLNGETIKVTFEGQLIDGQHRLQACVDANCPFESYVVIGVDADTFDTIDMGKKRTAGDIIGIDGCRNATSTAAAVRWIVAVRSNQWHVSSNKISPDEIRLFLAAEPEVEESVAKALIAKAVIAPGMAGALHYLFAKKDVAAADKFFNDLGRGTDLTAGDAVLVLRERLIQERLKKTRLPAVEVCSLCIRAWARRRGEAERTVTLRGSIVGGDGKRSFPEIM